LWLALVSAPAATDYEKMPPETASPSIQGRRPAIGRKRCDREPRPRKLALCTAIRTICPTGFSTGLKAGKTIGRRPIAQGEGLRAG